MANITSANSAARSDVSEVIRRFPHALRVHRWSAGQALGTKGFPRRRVASGRSRHDGPSLPTIGPDLRGSKAASRTPSLTCTKAPRSTGRNSAALVSRSRWLTSDSLSAGSVAPQLDFRTAVQRHPVLRDTVTSTLPHPRTVRRNRVSRSDYFSRAPRSRGCAA